MVENYASYICAYKRKLLTWPRQIPILNGTDSKKKKIQKLLPVAAQKIELFFFFFLTVLIIAVEMQVND